MSLGYLHWLRDLDDLREPLKTVVEREYERRFRPPPPPPVRYLPLQPPHPEVFRDVVRAGFRAVALRNHPEHGEDTQVMQRVNEVRDGARKHGLMA